MNASVYRLYAFDDSLLYVGQSIEPARRIRNHRTRQTWGPLIARAEVTEPMPLADALEAEWWAINTERPIHNIRTRNGYTPPHMRPLAPAQRAAWLRVGGEALSHALRGERVPARLLAELERAS